MARKWMFGLNLCQNYKEIAYIGLNVFYIVFCKLSSDIFGFVFWKIKNCVNIFLC